MVFFLRICLIKFQKNIAAIETLRQLDEEIEDCRFSFNLLWAAITECTKNGENRPDLLIATRRLCRLGRTMCRLLELRESVAE